MHSPDGVRKWSKTGSYKSTTIEELISKRSREGPEPVQNRPDNRPKPVQNGQGVTSSKEVGTSLAISCFQSLKLSPAQGSDREL